VPFVDPTDARQGTGSHLSDLNEPDHQGQGPHSGLSRRSGGAGRSPRATTTVTIGRDLFDAWTVSICYGRIGQDGQQKRFLSPKAEEMRQVIRDRLRRRLSATAG